MSSKLAIFLMSGILAGAGAAYLILNLPARDPTQQASQGRAAIGGPFSLIDTTGTRRTEKDYLGKPMLVFFGFTNCPDICPSALQTITVALDTLGDKADRLTPVFITLDPERDTPEVLAAYVKSFHSRIQGLTGSPEEVQAAIKAYRVYAKKVADESDPSRYSVDHSGFFYLMDAQGTYLTHFPHSIDAEQLAAKLLPRL